MAEKTNPFREKMLDRGKQMEPKVKEIVEKHLRKWKHGKNKKPGDLEKAARAFADELMVYMFKKHNLGTK